MQRVVGGFIGRQTNNTYDAIVNGTGAIKTEVAGSGNNVLAGVSATLKGAVNVTIDTGLVARTSTETRVAGPRVLPAILV